VPVALGADDPLLFRSGLLDQYAAVRVQQGLDDAALAGLAADAVRGVRHPTRCGSGCWRASTAGWPPHRPEPRVKLRRSAGHGA
jgi:adenosine deaminase